MPLTSLDGDVVPETSRTAARRPFAPSKDDEQSLGGGEATVGELAEERRAHPLVLRRGLHHPQDPPLPRARDAERDDDPVGGEAFPVEHEHQPLAIVEPPLLKVAQRSRG